jgi:AraC-like DNA-binding protein
MLKEQIPFIDIETQYKISPSFLSGINHGTYFFDDKLNYPLCRYYKEDKDYDELIDLLINSDLQLSKIAQQLSMGYSTVKKINAGTLRPGLYPTYPVRKITANEIRANKIKQLLLNSNYSKTEISKILHVDLETIRRINIGQSFYDNKLSYPLRSL